MANKPMKRCSAAYGNREMQIKATVRSHTRLLEWPRCRTPTPPNAGEDEEQEGLPSFIAGGNAKWCSHCGRQFGDFLQN